MPQCETLTTIERKFATLLRRFVPRFGFFHVYLQVAKWANGTCLQVCAVCGSLRGKMQRPSDASGTKCISAKWAQREGKESATEAPLGERARKLNSASLSLSHLIESRSLLLLLLVPQTPRFPARFFQPTNERPMNQIGSSNLANSAPSFATQTRRAKRQYFSIDQLERKHFLHECICLLAGRLVTASCR